MIPHSATCIGEDERAAVDRVLRSGHIAQGAEVEAFERECATAFGYTHAVAVNSGTSAMHLALLALGLPPGTPVIIPAYACTALPTAIRLAGGEPILCDVTENFTTAVDTIPDEQSFAIIPHLFGAPSAMPPLPYVIEDLAQSIGGPAHDSSPIAITSFYATKMMTTGEGGMILTNTTALAEFARERRDYDKRDDFTQRYNYKMTDMQAAMGRVQLQRLPDFVSRRRAIAQRYHDAFTDLPLRLPEGPDHVFYRYVIASPDRDALEAHVRERGVDAKRPVFRPAHHYLGGTFPGAEAAHQTALSLPIHPALVDDDVDRVIDSVRSFYI